MRRVACLLLVLAISDARDVVRRRGKKIARLPADLSHWEELAGFGIPESDIPVAKYRSKLTGLTIAVARAETPIVNGWVTHGSGKPTNLAGRYFCLPTEAHDNDGLPHTLEHLIFMGSEDYPYKEVILALMLKLHHASRRCWTCWPTAALLRGPMLGLRWTTPATR